MKNELNTKWNKADSYSVSHVEQGSIPSKVAFRFIPNERFKEDRRFQVATKDSIECLKMSPLEEELVARVALSKYLTVRQMIEFIQLQGFAQEESVVRDALFQLETKRVLTRYKMYAPKERDTLIFYGLNFWGMMKARRDLGISFHKGNMWYSKHEREVRGIPEDTDTDVKRILAGNQIILGALKSNVVMERFGVMETFRPMYTDPQEEKQEKVVLFRPTVNVKINESSILAYEVVRDYPSSYRELTAKIERYYKLLEHKQYLKSNYHGYTEVPQIVFCGQSLEHNRKIKKYLQERGFWNPELITILFTEDLLNIQNTKKSIYEIDEDEKLVWYELPIRGENESA